MLHCCPCASCFAGRGGNFIQNTECVQIMRVRNHCTCCDSNSDRIPTLTERPLDLFRAKLTASLLLLLLLLCLNVARLVSTLASSY